jgi:cytochrome c biogenesis protein CcmG/thiol:disulfide interchange protein DsbE
MARRWLLFVPPAVFGLLAGLFVAGMVRDDPDALPSTLVGRAAPAFGLAEAPPGPALLPDVPELTDAALRAPGVKLVNFWASWCAPCRVEHPTLVRLAAEGVPVYGINYKDAPDQARGFLAELGNPYAAIGTDPTGRIALAWGVYGVPETYVLDGEGRVTFRFAGPVTDRILETILRPEIARAGGG